MRMFPVLKSTYFGATSSKLRMKMHSNQRSRSYQHVLRAYAPPCFSFVKIACRSEDTELETACGRVLLPDVPEHCFCCGILDHILGSDTSRYPHGYVGELAAF